MDRSRRENVAVTSALANARHTNHVSEQTPVTFLFTDIEGSTRLWEQQPERMPQVMARHDAISRAAVERNRGTIVKMTGDGVHAAFDHPLDALVATLEIQQQLSKPEAAESLP